MSNFLFKIVWLPLIGVRLEVGVGTNNRYICMRTNIRIFSFVFAAFFGCECE